MYPFPNRDASVHRDWPADVRYVAAKDGARIAEKGEIGVALGNDRPLAFIRVQILVKTTVNDKRQKDRIPATKLQWLPARHAILTSGSGRMLDGRESLRAGRDAQLLPCRPADRYPGPNAHTGPDGRTSVNQPSAQLHSLRASRLSPPTPPHYARACVLRWDVWIVRSSQTNTYCACAGGRGAEADLRHVSVSERPTTDIRETVRHRY